METAMRFSTLLLIAGLLALGFGAGFLFVPGPALGAYGVTTDAGGLLMSRFFGAALGQLGLVIILVREVRDLAAQRAIALGSFLGSAAGMFVALMGQLSGVVNTLGWSSVLIYGLLLVGYARFAFGKPAAS
jgi:hypothetical protein